MSIYECLNLSILSLHIGKILIICTTIPNLIFYIQILKKRFNFVPCGTCCIFN